MASLAMPQGAALSQGLGDALDRIGLVPTRGSKGPVTARRQARSWAIYGALVLLGATPLLLGMAPAWRAAGLGLWAPGAGFLVSGGWIAALFPLVLALFVTALIAWFWAGMVIAPAIVWLGSAALAGVMARDHAAPDGWWPAPLIAALVVGGVIGGFARINARTRAAAVVRGAAREGFLAQELARVEAMAAQTPDPAARAMSDEQLAGLRYLLDRTLQPVDRFDGFTILDQFQPAALRYQINHMGFALGLAQGTYVPNFRGYMGLAQRNLIDKYLLPKVWSYWVLESCWGHLNFTDWDPAGRDNIMLTGWFAAHVGQYMLATGDRRYCQPGSLTFRLNARTAWEHDFSSIVGSVDANYARARFGHYACEPNWIYPICNHYGMLALVSHDAVCGTGLVDRHLPGWVRGMDAEFIDAAGSIVGLRSQWTGMPVPFPVGEAGYAFFENAFLPRRARQLWAIARHEAAPLIREEAGGPRMKMPGEGLDAGKYAAGHTGAYATYLVSAREFGDAALAQAALAGLEADCAPSREGGVLRYTMGSNISNATAILGLLMDTGDFRRSFTTGPGAQTLAGPMIETLDYPAVLVARAWSDGRNLDAVFMPGTGGGRFAIPLSQLEPGRRYALSGACEDMLVADAQGQGTFTIDLRQRLSITVTPA